MPVYSKPLFDSTIGEYILENPGIGIYQGRYVGGVLTPIFGEASITLGPVTVSATSIQEEDATFDSTLITFDSTTLTWDKA